MLQSCLCPDGEMDITTVFGTVVGGSNPSRGTIYYRLLIANKSKKCAPFGAH